ncbi:MAG: DUF3180 domain-containing protein [Microbacterium sp.]|uniref:DUF3180 domain-containing protein n=1 Tax=Microbacterium sp. TaxID=51671 RepID=UPI003A8777AF
MKRTGPVAIIVAALLGAATGFLLDQLLTANARPTFTPTLSLPIVLVLIGGLVVVFAVPIRRAARGDRVHVNPFRALRVAVLAKASSIVGAVAGGFAAGLLLFLATRPVTPSLGSMSEIIASLVAGVILVAAGLVAEHLCIIRKDDDDEHPGDPGLPQPPRP